MLSTLDQSVAKVINVGEYIRGLSNPIGVSKGKGMASKCNCVVPNNGNIVATLSNYVMADKGKYVAIDVECVVEVKEAD